MLGGKGWSRYSCAIEYPDASLVDTAPCLTAVPALVGAGEAISRTLHLLGRAVCNLSLVRLECVAHGAGYRRSYHFSDYFLTHTEFRCEYKTGHAVGGLFVSRPVIDERMLVRSYFEREDRW